MGWHELRWDAHAFAVGGETQFFDEESLGDYMVNCFNDVFTKHLVEMGGELRYSLLRDQFKLGLLAHAVVFGQLPPPGQPEPGAFAGSVGLAGHVLMWDAISIDAALSLGLRSGGITGSAFSLNISQVY